VALGLWGNKRQGFLPLPIEDESLVLSQLQHSLIPVIVIICGKTISSLKWEGKVYTSNINISFYLVQSIGLAKVGAI